MMFMQIVDPSSMIINATVNQVDVDTLRIGQKAKVRFDAYPDLEVPAHVAAIGAMTRAGGQRASYRQRNSRHPEDRRMDPRIIPDLSVSIDVVVELRGAGDHRAACGGVPRHPGRHALCVCQEWRHMGAPGS